MNRDDIGKILNIYNEWLDRCNASEYTWYPDLQDPVSYITERLELNESDSKEQSEDKQYYYIIVRYQTGDSFSSYNDSDGIILPWSNIDIVNENIRRLQKQTEMNQKMSAHNFTPDNEKKDIIKEWDESGYAVYYNKDSSFAWDAIDTESGKRINPTGIMLLKDDGSEFRYDSSAWLGFFDSKWEFSVGYFINHLADS